MPLIDAPCESHSHLWPQSRTHCYEDARFLDDAGKPCQSLAFEGRAAPEACRCGSKYYSPQLLLHRLRASHPDLDVLANSRQSMLFQPQSSSADLVITDCKPNRPNRLHAIPRCPPGGRRQGAG